MREPATPFLNWFVGFLGRRMWWAIVLAVVFVGFVFASNGVSWTSATITILVAILLTGFMAIVAAFREVFAAANERKKP